MFTNRKIPLSSLLKDQSHTILRDAEIAFAGKLTTPLEHRIVPVSTHDHIAQANTATGVAALITPPDLSSEVPDGLGLILSDNPLETLAKIQTALAQTPSLQWDSFETRIHPTAQISKTAEIASTDVVIGPATQIGPGVVVEPRTLIGARCRIAAHTHLGAQGFEKDPGNPGHLLEQSGGVKIADDVTIQSSCVISRAIFGGFTQAGDRTLIDSLVSVSHDCNIAPDVIICAKASLSGRVKIERGAYIGPGSSISNGITVAQGGQVSLGAVVTRDVLENEKVSGNFALPHEKWLSFIKQFR
ncbi:MAG: hypothetical protein AAF340_04210 [Pseudomonadota bacterium]